MGCVAITCLACLFDASDGWSLVRLPLCASLVLTVPDVVAGERGREKQREGGESRKGKDHIATASSS